MLLFMVTKAPCMKNILKAGGHLQALIPIIIGFRPEVTVHCVHQAKLVTRYCQSPIGKVAAWDGRAARMGSSARRSAMSVKLRSASCSSPASPVSVSSMLTPPQPRPVPASPSWGLLRSIKNASPSPDLAPFSPLSPPSFSFVSVTSFSPSVSLFFVFSARLSLLFSVAAPPCCPAPAPPRLSQLHSAPRRRSRRRRRSCAAWTLQLVVLNVGWGQSIHEAAAPASRSRRG